jgi:hypothetical protein
MFAGGKSSGLLSAADRTIGAYNRFQIFIKLLNTRLISILQFKKNGITYIKFKTKQQEL